MTFYQYDRILGCKPMATILVRLLDDDVADRLKRRASSNNRSMAGEVRHVLKCAA
ncbi:MAG: hypothetical protein OXC26_10905 [Albidovulum sp.]|nr:hypothetical protein [Albidovulum sp.]